MFPDVTLSIRPLRPTPAESSPIFPADPLTAASAAVETKDATPPAGGGNLKNGMSIARQATEKHKWKFLGW